MTVAVVDLKCANLASVRFALDRLDASYEITQDAGVIASAERVILPGVGSARFAADQMDALDLRETLQSLTQPVLGICLGMQLLFERSAEGDAICIGLLAGEVTKLAIPEGEPWPHMGWSRLTPTRADSRLMHNIEPGAYAYFVHGYAAPVTEATAATAEYGATFAAVVEQGHVYGCQFHPERSSAAGATILANFLDAPC
ncbi:MAG: imidazole glycerol phosphate synthase subunit HisH [Maricaulaceae bacterium]|jgi:glutamine amidotransferase